MIIAHVNQRERDVYDNYPMLIRALIKVANLPLDEMLTAIDRMAATRAFIGPRGTEAVEPDVLEDHRALVNAAIRFRDTYVELAMRAARGDD